MIFKAQIKKYVFHLPRNQEDLTNLIKERFYEKKELVKSSINKMYSITKLETNHKGVDYNRDLNIFLLNIYLLHLESKGIENLEDLKIVLSNDNIKNELKKDFKNINSETPLEEIEEIIQQSLNEDTKEEKNIFNMKWIKETDRKIRE